MSICTYEENIPEGWKVRKYDDGKKKGKKNYTLNDASTEKKLKEAAVLKDLEVKPMKDDSSFTMQFSTGNYMTTMVPLLRLWQSLVGQEIDPNDVEEMEVMVESVKVGTDKKGTTTDTIVKLVVDGETITITLYDTTLKVRVQGKEKHIEYTNKVLIPFLEEKTKMNAKKSRELNEMILALSLIHI